MNNNLMDRSLIGKLEFDDYLRYLENYYKNGTY